MNNYPLPDTILTYRQYYLALRYSRGPILTVAVGSWPTLLMCRVNVKHDDYLEITVFVPSWELDIRNIKNYSNEVS